MLVSIMLFFVMVAPFPAQALWTSFGYCFPQDTRALKRMSSGFSGLGVEGCKLRCVLGVCECRP